MSLSIRARLTLSFSLFFGILLVPFLGAIYYFLSVSLEADLKEQTIHNYSQIMIFFDEQPDWETALDELYQKQADEFNIQIRLLDTTLRPAFVSYGLKKTPLVLNDFELKDLDEGAFWSSGRVHGVPYIVLTQEFFPKDQKPHYCQIWKSKKNMRDIQRKFLIIVALGIPFIFALSVLTGLFFSKRALHPFEMIRQKTDALQSDDLSTRLPYPLHQDETYRLTETLNLLLDRIEKSFAGIRRFTADASHEMRIPLTNLKGMIEVALRKRRSVEEYEVEFKDALDEVERLSELVRSLLVLARIDAKKNKPELKKENLKNFLNEFYQSAQALNRENKVKLILEDIPPVDLSFDSEKMKQALLILVENGIKYNKVGGTVVLSSRTQEEGVVLSVSDTGGGIPQEHQARVFERFYRVDDSRDREKGGTGLGLSIARSIAQAHNGTLTLESAVGQGSTFHLFIPFH